MLAFEVVIDEDTAVINVLVGRKCLDFRRFSFCRELLELFEQREMCFINRCEIFRMTLEKEHERCHIVQNDSDEKGGEQPPFRQVLQQKKVVVAEIQKGFVWIILWE